MDNYHISEKVHELQEKSQAIGDFLEWLKQNHWICKWDDESGNYYPTMFDINKILFEYYELDYDGYQKEQLDILRKIREKING